MKDEKIKLIKELGFEISSKEGNGKSYISMQSVPTQDIVLKLLSILSFEDGISFWDSFHTTITDPGGYVSAYMLGESKCVYMEGNHGWSSDFKPISATDFADLMIKNWDKDCDDGRYLNAIEIFPHYNMQRDLFLYNL